MVKKILLIQAQPASGGEDSYGSPLGNPVTTQDSYRAPKRIPPPLVSTNTYSAPSSPQVQSVSLSNVNSASIAVGGSYGSGASNSYGPLIIQDNSGDTYSAPTSSILQQDAPQIAPASDSYGGAVAPIIADAAPAGDSYGGAIAPVIADAAPAIDSYGGAIAPVVADAAPASDSYGGAIAPVIADAAPAIDSYGGAVAPVFVAADAPISTPVDSAPVIYQLSNPDSSPASDSYGGAVGPVIVSADPTLDLPTVAVSAPDSYGTPQSDVLPPQSDPDDYDPNDIPADQAAPLPGYADDSLPGYADDYDPNDIPPDQAEDGLPSYGNSDPLDSYGEARSPLLDPIISDNSVDTGSQQTFDVYGSALAPVGTSAPGLFPYGF